jgi:hypothetical protein
VAHEALESSVQPGAQHPRPLLRFAGREHLDDRKPNGCRERIAPERRPVLARTQHSQHILVADDRAHRHDAAAERLAEQVEVGHDADEVARERRPGAAEAGLDLVRDHENLPAARDVADRRQEIGGRHDDAGLALDRLEQHRDGVVVDRGLERIDVAVRHGDEPGRVWTEVRARLLIVAEADDRRRAAVKVARHHDDLRAAVGHALHAIAPRAGDLHRGLDRLGARIHGQHHVFAGERGERLGERAESVVVERAARECDAVELFLGGGDEHLIAVAEVHGRVGRKAVEVSLALDVRDPSAFTRRNHNGERVVVVREVRVLDRDQLGGSRRRDRPHRRSSRVQHFTPPPPRRSSERSTPMGL